jgi:hypothetical protein
MNLTCVAFIARRRVRLHRTTARHGIRDGVHIAVYNGYAPVTPRYLCTASGPNTMATATAHATIVISEPR